MKRSNEAKMNERNEMKSATMILIMMMIMMIMMKLTELMMMMGHAESGVTDQSSKLIFRSQIDR